MQTEWQSYSVDPDWRSLISVYTVFAQAYPSENLRSLQYLRFSTEGEQDLRLKPTGLVAPDLWYKVRTSN